MGKKTKLQQQREQAKPSPSPEQVANAKRLRKKVKEQVYPELQRTDSIEECKNLIQMLGVVVRSGFQELMGEVKVGELKMNGKSLFENLDPNNKDIKFYVNLLTILGTETIKDAVAILDGFNASVEMILRDENKKKKITDFDQQFNEKVFYEV